MYPIYRYKLDYKDFLKMYIGDLKQIQKYLFLQTQPIEIEVYLEQLLLSTNHRVFPELGMQELAEKYPKTITELLTAIIEDGDKLSSKEYLKVSLNTDSDFLELLIKAYMTLIEKSLDIQRRLLLNIDNEKYTPITIITNSVILNRLGTSLHQFISEDKIPRKEIYIKEAKNLQELQIRNLNVKMLVVTDETPNLIHDYIKDTHLFQTFYKEYSSKSKITWENEKSRQYLNAIINMALYETILNKNKCFERKDDMCTNLYLPYFDSPTRNEIGRAHV